MIKENFRWRTFFSSNEKSFIDFFLWKRWNWIFQRQTIFFLIKKIKLENLSPSHSNIEIDLFLLPNNWIGVKNAPSLFFFFRTNKTSIKLLGHFKERVYKIGFKKKFLEGFERKIWILIYFSKIWQKQVNLKNENFFSYFYQLIRG